MKKSLSIVMVFVFFYSIMGSYLNFTIEQYRLKEEIKEKIISSLPEKELTLVKITASDEEKLTWMEDGKEFRYNGSMYDIVKIKRNSGVTYYYCFCDVNESKLLINLDKLVKNQTDNSPSKTTQKKQDITYLFQSILFPQDLPTIPVLYLDCPSSYKSIISDILSPPPRNQGII
jgi:hypothetical protein